MGSHRASSASCRRLVVSWTQMSLGWRSRMTRTRSMLLLLVLVATASAQINFGGGSSNSRTPSSSGGQRPSSIGSSSRPSSGSSIQFANKNPSAKEVAQGLQSKRQTLATVLKSQGVTPAVDVNIRGTLGTRRLGDRCTTPQRTAGTCQYIFARQCRPVLTAILTQGVTSQIISYLVQAIRSPCGFLGFDFTLCCEDQNQPQITTQPPTTPRPTTQRPTTQRPTTQRPTTQTTAAPQQDNCGTNSNNRIVGGTEARQGDWPWAVVLGTKNAFSNRFSVQCGGTLLDQTTVLTAAHCFDQAGGPNVVRLGDHDINTSSDGAQAVDVSIRRIIQHPGWDSNSLENDICILKLSQPIQYSRDIRRACLPNQYKGQDLPSVLARPQPIVVGWGSTSTGTGPTNRLRQAPVQMVTQQQCAQAYRQVSRVTIGATKLCAGEGTRDTCNGDSGGGLFSRNLGGGYAVVGVTSFGVECARDDFPGVYTRVDEYLPWIQQNMG